MHGQHQPDPADRHHRAGPDPARAGPASTDPLFSATTHLLREVERRPGVDGSVGIVCAVAEAGGRLWQQQRGSRVRAQRLLEVTAWWCDLGFPELVAPAVDALNA